jgi:hypothetical protein
MASASVPQFLLLCIALALLLVSRARRALCYAAAHTKSTSCIALPLHLSNCLACATSPLPTCASFFFPLVNVAMRPQVHS